MLSGEQVDFTTILKIVFNDLRDKFQQNEMSIYLQCRHPNDLRVSEADRGQWNVEWRTGKFHHHLRDGQLFRAPIIIPDMRADKF